ncbi:hypothetical protein ACJRO7_014483 [Eucalyptus globulus]|uniref:F-box domain-containing protein n=1 Tax=Eucalyptus globulus TaxID=34317 RepID=A0ABD3L0B2_EUCGL
MREEEEEVEEGEAEIDRLPVDVLAHCFFMIPSFADLARASGVCRKWKRGVKLSLGRRERLSFVGLKMDDDSTARVVRRAYALRELDILKICWGCHITDEGLYIISLTNCAAKLMSISLLGMTGVTDQGVVKLIARATALQHLNIVSTFITDESLYAIANSCPHLKCCTIIFLQNRFQYK